jgi:histone arginine demethylase JMJD6
MDNWKAKNIWNPSYFGKHFMNLEFLAGYYNTPKEAKIDTDESGKVKLSYDFFFRHTIRDKTKNLYIFDPNFGERDSSKKLLNDYKVLDIFQDNVFAEKIPDVQKRPPYRWVLIGTTGSGGGLHIDPLGTSAWNALFYGKKLWILFPPGTPLSENDNNQGEKWLKYEYPKIKHHKHIKLVQNPGEIIFVPAGWWHTAINVGVTFAVTQNYLHPHNTDFGLREVRKHRPELVKYF